MAHCLVIDSSRVIRTVVARIAGTLTRGAVEAANGAEALQACCRMMPDIVLMGRLGDMTAAAFMRSLAALSNGRKPIVICCVIENDTDRIAEALRSGADEFLQLPFDRAAVAQMLTQFGLAAAA